VLKEPYAIMNAEMTAEFAAAIAENLAGGALTESNLPQARVPTGGGMAWTMSAEDEDPTKTIVGIIVGTRMQRSYWAQSFDDGGGGAPPDCFSPDGVTGTSTLKGFPGGECAKCPMAQWGSAKGSGQACQLRRKVYMLRQDDILPIVVVIPPSSLRNVNKYLTQLAAKGLRYRAVVTSLALAKAQSKEGITYAEVVPAMVEKLDEAEVKLIASYVQSMAPQLALSAPVAAPAGGTI